LHQGGLPNPTSLFVRKTPYSRHAYDPIEKVELPVDPKREAYESKVRAALEKDAAKRERALEREKRGKKKKPSRNRQRAPSSWGTLAGRRYDDK